MSFLSQVLFLKLFSSSKYFLHRLMFLKMELHVRATVQLNKLAGVCDVVPGTSHHLGEFSEQVVLAIYLNHLV